jgi:ATP-dependent DNA helicase RecG
MSLHINLAELSRRESERVEWKENVANVDSVLRTICAFSNDHANLGGGYVVCGAREEQDEHGFQSVRNVGLESARLKEIEGRVLALCRSHIDPPVCPQVEELPAETPDRRVLVFIVPATRHAHSYRAKPEGSPAYYVRVGRETILARNGVYRDLLVRKGAMEPWDRRAAAACTPEDIDLIVLREYLTRMGAWEEPRSVEDVLSDTATVSVFSPPLLEREGLTGRLRPRNFAMLLFGRNPLKAAPGAHLVLSRYPGTDRSDPVAQRFEVTGSVVHQVERALELLAPETATMFDKLSERPNRSLYPRRALLEALANAVVHRDYENDQPIRVTVFSDRIEILSPGGLPPAVPSDKFLAGRASPFWRNQTLAHFFNRLQLAQAEGQGIPTILRVMREEGCPEPRFELEPERVITVLPARKG